MSTPLASAHLNSTGSAQAATVRITPAPADERYDGESFWPANRASAGAGVVRLSGLYRG